MLRRILQHPDIQQRNAWKIPAFSGSGSVLLGIMTFQTPHSNPKKKNWQGTQIYCNEAPNLLLSCTWKAMGPI